MAVVIRAIGVLCLLLPLAHRVTSTDPDWWKHTIIYQVYPRSFQDSDGDGVGDLQGIKSRLDYIQYLGVDTIWLSPIYTSPMADFGYDVADYRDIDPIFGTMADFDDLLEAIHERGMYLLMDFIPNHTSDQHPWFVESRKGGEDNPYSDYYRWSPGKLLDDGTRAPPNNWLSIFGGSAWEWDEGRQEFYLHQFVKEQPDLDYRNPNVVREIENILGFWAEKGVDGFRVDAIRVTFEVEDLSLDEPRSYLDDVLPEAIAFWLAKGVDGFRIDAILTMFEVEDLSLDEPLSHQPDMLPYQHEYLLHPYTLNQPEIHDIIRSWRDMFDQYDAKSGHHTFMQMELYDPSMVESMKYYHSGADFPFNFNLVYLNATCGGACTRALVDSWLDVMPEGKWPNHVFGNHDNLRITTRKSPVHAVALNMLLLTLPGTPTSYYGEELALRDVTVTYEDTQDPYGINMGPELFEKYSRDPARAPMQWSAGPNSGFSSADKTWLPVNPDYVTRNVEAQMSDPKSPLNIYKQVAVLRQDPAFRNSRLHYVTVNDNVISYVRQDRNTAYLIALNLGNEASVDDYVTTFGGDVISSGRVVVDSGSVDAGLTSGSHVTLRGVHLEPGDGIIVILSESDNNVKIEL